MVPEFGKTRHPTTTLHDVKSTALLTARHLTYVITAMEISMVYAVTLEREPDTDSKIYHTGLLVGMSARGRARGPGSLRLGCTHAGSAAQP